MDDSIFLYKKAQILLKLIMFSLYLEEESEGDEETEKEYSCHKWNVTFIIKSNMIDNLKDEHSNSNVKQEYSNEKKISNERPFPCKLCDYRFKRNSHLTRHTLKVHKKRTAKPLVKEEMIKPEIEPEFIIEEGN